MKKRYAFLLILLLFIIYVVLYCIFVPKVIFINKSRHDIYIFGYYVDDAEKLRKKYPEDKPLKIRYERLKKDRTTNYFLGFFSNKNRDSSFWARWRFVEKNTDGTLIQNEMALPKEDFGWKNITFIIDENGDYHKVEKSSK